MSIYLPTLLYILTNSQSVTITQNNCTDTLPTGWSFSYCPEDITRIEYQINIDPLQLTNDGTNTVDQIDLFLKWIVDNFQQDKYLGEFRLKTTKINKYYRNVTELFTQVKPQPPPSSLKYRRTFGSFQNTDTYGESSLKYQNDLTLEVDMSGPLLPFDYTDVTPNIAYSHIFEYKLEPNVFIDTCNPTNWTNYLYGTDSTSYSAKIEFHDDDEIVAVDTDGPIMINVTNWKNISDYNAFYCGDCNSNSCICCDIEEFLTDYCQYLDFNLMDEFPYMSEVDYVVDVDFDWYKNKDWGSDDANLTSEGKLTFLVLFADGDAKNADIPKSGEFSVKLNKEDTVDGEWANLILFVEGFIMDLVFPSDEIPPNEWLDYTDCEPVSTEYITSCDDGDCGNYNKTAANKQVDVWFIVGMTFIVLFGVTTLLLCYFIWMYYKAVNKVDRYEKAATYDGFV